MNMKAAPDDIFSHFDMTNIVKMLPNKPNQLIVVHDMSSVSTIRDIVG